MAKARAGEVLLAGSVYQELAHTVRADLLGRKAVRGRAGQIDLYRVALTT